MINYWHILVCKHDIFYFINRLSKIWILLIDYFINFWVEITFCVAGRGLVKQSHWMQHWKQVNALCGQLEWKLTASSLGCRDVPSQQHARNKLCSPSFLLTLLCLHSLSSWVVLKPGRGVGALNMFTHLCLSETHTNRNNAFPLFLLCPVSAPILSILFARNFK